MTDVTSETPVEEVVGRYPAAVVVLSRYGLDAYEESDPSPASLARFAEERGIPVERLLSELTRAVEISEQEPPPSSFLSLLETHEWLDEHFLLHQEALLAGDLPLALELLRTVEEGQREHIRVEEELLLPVYERAGRIPGGDPRFYINEHRKMLAILDGFEETLPRLLEAGLTNARREIVELFDQGYWFKRLLEHHDKREGNILYPALDHVTSEEELHTSHPTHRRREARRCGRQTLPGEALGGGAHAGLALEVPGDPGALRQEGCQLPGADKGGLHPAVVSTSASSVPFEIVSKAREEDGQDPRENGTRKI